MIRRSRLTRSWRVLAVCSAASSLLACSAILDLESPPGGANGDGGSGGRDGSFAEASAGDDSATGGDAGVQGGDDAMASVDAGSCALLDAGDAATIYSPFAQFTESDGASSVEVFDAKGVLGFPGSYSGAVSDGRYLYFPTRTNEVARFDTQAGRGLADTSGSWQIFNLSTSHVLASGAAEGFSGAVFDGRYVYFVPWNATVSGALAPTSIVARFDSLAPFTSASAWSTFDVSTLDGSGAVLSGFLGGTFDGRYLYLVPGGDTGRGPVIRAERHHVADAGTGAKDAGAKDAGDGGDGGDASTNDVGDAGEASVFVDPSHWTTFDLSAAGAVSPYATGFAGAVFDGTSVFFVPHMNGAFDGGLHSGQSGIAVRLNDITAPFDASSSYTAFDLTTIDGFGAGFTGGAFDGRYVYFVPRSNGVAFRFDRTAGAFTNASGWSTYDLSRLLRPIAPSTAAPAFLSATFDGRFVYFTPAGLGASVLVRFDTMSDFGTDCAWSTLDVSALASTTDAGADAGPFQNGGGSVFDGEYVYFAPASTGVFARFRARSTKATLPLRGIPQFYGSFL